MLFCRICLQPTPRTVEIDATLDAFYDELVYYDVIQHPALSVCMYCEHLLKKAYNFRQKCRRAHILLKLWTKDTEKKVALNFLWKLLPKNPITVVNNDAIQKVFACINNKLETDTETTIDNDEQSSLVPIDYKQESKNDIKSFYQEFSETVLKAKEENENNTNNFDITANDCENTDPNKASDNESDDAFNDNFDDFFKPEPKQVDLNDESDVKAENKKKAKAKRREMHLNKKRARSRAILEEYIADGLLKDLELDDETMLIWFDRLPLSTLLLKGILNSKYCLLLEKWRGLFRFLKRRYDPKYEAMFEIEFLATHEQKVAEFVSRQHSEQFIKAPCKCFICFKVLARRGLMEYHHKVWHDESLPVKCDICLCGFHSTKMLKNHMYRSHDVVYRCKRCPFIARSREIMQFHYEEHINNGIFCKVCGKQFRTTKTMTQHLLCHKRGASCPFCARSYATYGLAMHMRCKHKDDPLFKTTPTLQCPECDSAFHYEEALNSHLQRDHIEYRCSCGEVFVDEMSLSTHTKETKHIRIKSEAKTDKGVVRCDICSTDVPQTSPFALYTHHRATHPNVPYICRDKRKDVVLCEHCGLACTLGQEYEDHLNTHTGEKPYECSECGARFETRVVAEHHLKVHTKNKEKVLRNAGVKYKCHVCEKGFAHRYYLSKHIQIHEDFNREVVTSRVVMPKFKVKNEEPDKLAKTDSVSKNKTQLGIHEDFNREVVTSRVVMPKFKVKNEEPDKLAKTDSVSKKKTQLGIHEDFNREVVTSRVVMPKFKVKIEKLNKIAKIDSLSKNMTHLQNEEIITNDESDVIESKMEPDDLSKMEPDESLLDEETGMDIDNEHCSSSGLEQHCSSSGLDPSMEIIFDFENEVVEEVVL